MDVARQSSLYERYYMQMFCFPPVSGLIPFCCTEQEGQGVPDWDGRPSALRLVALTTERCPYARSPAPPSANPDSQDRQSTAPPTWASPSPRPRSPSARAQRNQSLPVALSAFAFQRGRKARALGLLRHGAAPRGRRRQASGPYSFGLPPWFPPHQLRPLPQAAPAPRPPSPRCRSCAVFSLCLAVSFRPIGTRASDVLYN